MKEVFTLVFLGNMVAGSSVCLAVDPDDTRNTNGKMRRSKKRTGVMILLQSLTDVWMLLSIGIMSSLNWWSSSREQTLACKVLPLTDILVLVLNSSVIFVLVWFRHFLVISLSSLPVKYTDVSEKMVEDKNKVKKSVVERNGFSRMVDIMHQGPSVRVAVCLLMVASVATIGYSFLRPRQAYFLELQPGFQFCVNKDLVLPCYAVVTILCVIHAVPAAFVYCLYNKTSVGARKKTVVQLEQDLTKQHTEETSDRGYFCLWLTLTSTWLPSLEAILITAILSRSDMAFNFLMMLSYAYGCAVFLFSFVLIIITFVDISSSSRSNRKVKDNVVCSRIY